MDRGAGSTDERSPLQVTHESTGLGDLLDASAVQALMDDMFELTRIPNALLDLHGNVLVLSGWQDACTQFHRAHPESCAACTESDLAQAEGVPAGETRGYKCRNGLWDVVTPLFVEGEHLGNVYAGQFFYDDDVVDPDFFRAQAERYDYDVDAYLSAIARVPRFSHHDVDKFMRFYSNMTGQLAFIGSANRRLQEASAELTNANQQLELRVEERTAQLKSTNDELAAVNARLQSINDELVSTNDELRIVTAAKDEFLAAMSHELRTPLNSILGFSGTLLSDLTEPLDDEQHRQVTMINNSGRHLLELINGLLDFAQLESGQLQLSIEDVDPVLVASEVLDSVRPLAEERGLYVKIDSAEYVPHVRTDRTKLRQILLNLLGNAVKFTTAGGITIRVRCTHDEVCFEVEDTGRGIATRDRKVVFDKFFQVPPEDGGKAVGTGLGLSVSLGLARLLRGDLEMRSEIGVGSTFTLRLPLEG